MERNISKEYLKAGIFEKWHKTSLAEYEGNENLTTFIRDYLNNPIERGIFMTGINGTGKTMLMNIMFKKFIDSGESALIVPYWEVVKAYIDSWSNKESVYNLMKKVKYLGIDDFGKSFEGTDNSKRMAKSAVEFLLTYRVQRLKPTFFTSNIQYKDLREEYGDDIASKLNEACVLVEIENKNKKKADYRYNLNEYYGF